MIRLFKSFLWFVILIVLLLIIGNDFQATFTSSPSLVAAFSVGVVSSFYLVSSSSHHHLQQQQQQQQELRMKKKSITTKKEYASSSTTPDEANDNDDSSYFPSCQETTSYTVKNINLAGDVEGKEKEEEEEEEDQQTQKISNNCGHDNSCCGNKDTGSSDKTRRRWIGSIVLAMTEMLRVTPPAPCHAFENGLPEMMNYTNKPKHPGTRPTNIGRQPGTGKLAPCDTGAPNCFSTTGESNDEEGFVLQTWKPNPHPSSRSSSGSGTATRVTNKSREQIMNELKSAIQSYPPGQARIDKGGFKIMTSTDNYVYIQFESMKHGFIDDVEFALLEDENNNNNNNSIMEVQVRSSSRIGFLDLGVNGKRLNWFATYLQTTYGWDIPEQITPTNYSDYFPMMPFSYDDYIRSVLSPETCPVPANPLECRDPPSGPA